MNHDTSPPLLPGEVLITCNEIGGIPIRFQNDEGEREDGKLFFSNFQSIIVLNNIVHTLPHAAILSMVSVKQSEQFERFNFYSRFLSLDIIDIPNESLSDLDIIKRYSSLKNESFCYQNNQKLRKGSEIYSVRKEFHRQGIKDKKIRISKANDQYGVLPTSPCRMVCSKVWDDQMLLLAVKKLQKRLPLITYVHNGNTFLLRGTRLKAPSEALEESFLKSLLSLSSSKKLLIIDLQDKEFPTHFYVPEFYTKECIIECIRLPSESDLIFAIDPPSNLHIDDEKIRTHVSQLFDASIITATALLRDQCLLLQNGTGKGILSVVAAVSQVIVDPYYRTIEGFGILVQKEFVSFGHDFGLRSVMRKTDKYSSIFLFFLNTVWCLMQQQLFAFEWNGDFLLFLMDSVYSQQFGSFLGACEKDFRVLSKKTLSIWTYVMHNRSSYSNPLYSTLKSENLVHALHPAISYLPFWKQYFLRFKCRFLLRSIEEMIKIAVSQHSKELLISGLNVPFIPCSASQTDFLNLTDINFSNNGLTCIPLCLLGAPNLRSLNLAHNEIQFLLDPFLSALVDKLSYLNHLYLGNNLIVKISEHSLANFQNLETLDLHSNRLHFISKLDFPHLTSLDLSDNPTLELNNAKFNLPKLLHVNLCRTLTKALPEKVKWSNLCTLNISHSQITSLSLLSSMPMLKELSVSSLCLNVATLPTYSEMSIYLERLDMNSLELTSFPSHYGTTLRQLVRLELGRNHLDHFPSAILQMVHLTHLDLQNNHICFLPKEIAVLKELTCLHLEHNNLRVLCRNIGKLSTLEYLNISHNKISHLPASIGYLKKLQTSRQFLYSDNPIVSPPRFMMDQGYDYAFFYLQNLLNGGENVIPCNVILLGKPKVGKTTFLHNLTSDISIEGYNIPSASQLAQNEYIGMEQMDFMIGGGALYRVSTWDLPSNEKYASLLPLLFSKTSLYFILCDITADNSNWIYGYLELIQLHCPDAPILIGYTLIDHVLDTYTDTIKKMREKFSRFPNVLGVHGLSCKLCKGINDAYFHVQSIFLHPDYRPIIPAPFIELQQLIKGENRIPPILTRDELGDMAVRCDIITRKEFYGALSWLQETKTIHILESLVLLDVNWLIDIINQFHNSCKYINHSIILYDDLIKMWNESKYLPVVQENLLRFLISRYYFVSIPVLESPTTLINRYIIPFLFPSKRPDIYQYFTHFPTEEDPHQFGRRYTFSFLPDQFLGELFSKLIHSLGVPSLYWKYGLVFFSTELYILIDVCPTTSSVDITIRSHDISVGFLIFQDVESCAMASMMMNIFIPCLQCLKEKNYSPYMFSLSICQQAVIDNIPFLECSLHNHTMPLSKLAPDCPLTHVKSYNKEIIDYQLNYLSLIPYHPFPQSVNEKTFLVVSFPVSVASEADGTTVGPNIKAFKHFCDTIQFMDLHNHPCIIKLSGFLMKTHFAILWDSPSLGSLYHITKSSFDSITWNFRYKCAYECACALRYLHSKSSHLSTQLTSHHVFIHNLDIIVQPNIKLAVGIPMAMDDTNWKAPELGQLDEKKCTEKSSVFAFGVILFELISGIPLFPPNEFKASIEQAKRPSFPPNTPSAFSQLIKSCWKQYPCDRPFFSGIINSLLKMMPEEVKCIIEQNVAQNEVQKSPKISPFDVPIPLCVRDSNDIEEEKIAITRSKNLEAKEEMKNISKLIRVGAPVTCILSVQNGNSSELWCADNQGHIFINSPSKDMICLPTIHSSILSLFLVKKYVWLLACDGVIYIYSIKTRTMHTNIPNVPVLNLEKIDESTLWGAGFDSYIYVFNSKEKRMESRIDREVGSVLCICYCHATNNVWMGCDLQDHFIDVYDVSGNVLVNHNSSQHTERVNDIIECHGTMWSCSSDNTVMGWNFDGKHLFTLGSHISPVLGLSQVGPYVWSVSWDGRVIIWNIECPSEAKQYVAHSGPISAIQFSHDKVWTSSWDGFIRQWTNKKETNITTLPEECT